MYVHFFNNIFNSLALLSVYSKDSLSPHETLDELGKKKKIKKNT